MLSELHKLFKLIWQKKKMLWLQITNFFTVYILFQITSKNIMELSLYFCHFLLHKRQI